MGIFEKIFPSANAKYLEKKGDDALNSKSAIIYYEEAIHYLKERSKYYEINLVYEKIGKSLLAEARKKDSPYIERNRDYRKAFEIFSNIGSELKEETAIEHCILSSTEETLVFYKHDILNNKSLEYWQDFIYKISEKVKNTPETKIVAKLLLREFLQLDANVSKPALIAFIKSFNLSDKHEAEMYLIAADSFSLPPLHRSEMYKLAAHCYRAAGLLSDWLNALEGQYIYYLEDKNFNYLLDDDDVYEIAKHMGNDALKDFFYSIMPSFLSDPGRISIQNCLNKKEYWTIFSKSLIKQIKLNGIDSLLKEEFRQDLKEVLLKKMQLDPESGIKLDKMIGLNSV